jgi:hypothetical protein
VKWIPKGDDQSNPEDTTRNQNQILPKDVQTEQIGVSSNILDLNKDAT